MLQVSGTAADEFREGLLLHSVLCEIDRGDRRVRFPVRTAWRHGNRPRPAQRRNARDLLAQLRATQESARAAYRRLAKVVGC